MVGAVETGSTKGFSETAPFAEGYLHSARAAAKTLGVAVIAVPCSNDADIQGAFTARAREGNGGIIGIADTFIADNYDLIIALAAQHRLPAIYGNPIFVKSGGLMVYSPDYASIYRRAAGYVGCYAHFIGHCVLAPKSDVIKSQNCPSCSASKYHTIFSCYGAKRTCRGHRILSDFDPKRT
jgi:hypothetical protein